MKQKVSRVYINLSLILMTLAAIAIMVGIFYISMPIWLKYFISVPVLIVLALFCLGAQNIEVKK